LSICSISLNWGSQESSQRTLGGLLTIPTLLKLPRVAAETALHVLAYNLTRVMNIIAPARLIAAIRA
jgi:hypothetical protein